MQPVLCSQTFGDEIADALIREGSLDPVDGSWIRQMSEQRARRVADALSRRTDAVALVINTSTVNTLEAAAMMRSCDAFGVQNVHLHSRGSQHTLFDETNAQQVRKVTAGVEKWLTLHHHPTLTETFTTLRKHGYLILSAAPPNSTSLHRESLLDVPISAKTAIAFGLHPKDEELIDKYCSKPRKSQKQASCRENTNLPTLLPPALKRDYILFFSFLHNSFSLSFSHQDGSSSRWLASVGHSQHPSRLHWRCRC